MRSALAQLMRDEMPASIKRSVDLRMEVAVRLHELMEAKNITQKQLAERLGKSPSEVSKWVGGLHNFTLDTLARIEAELGEAIIVVHKTPERKPKPASNLSYIPSGRAKKAVMLGNDNHLIVNSLLHSNGTTVFKPIAREAVRERTARTTRAAAAKILG